jgi:nucleoid-associated protein YgaU
MSADPKSRHAELESYELVLVPGERPLRLFVPRRIEEPAPSLLHTVTASDRLDLLAHRYLGDPFLFWRIADANPALAPEDVLDPGAEIAIPAKK